MRSTERFLKKMRVVIGSGTTVEVRKVSGFGSLLVDEPLLYTHPAGAPVVGYANAPNVASAIKKRYTSCTSHS